MSPKNTRKDRGRTLRSKRERAASPGAKENKTPTTSRSRSGSGSLPRGGAGLPRGSTGVSGGNPREPVKEAMSPSVAESTRAVFAAYIWHEGIVHDAMACASYLKFHPNLAKEIPKLKSTDSTPRNMTPSGTMKKHSRQNSEKQNLNEAMKAVGNLEHAATVARSKERCYSEGGMLPKPSPSPPVQCSTSAGGGTVVINPTAGITVTPQATSHFKLEENKDSDLPTTLQYLVYFWEELSNATLKVVTQNLILPSPAVTAKGRKNDRKEKERDRKAKKSKKGAGEAKPSARGNLFGEAAGALFGGGGGGERETMCELCGGMFPHPVTYHMKQAHPGCGHHAGGQGYNSGGHFCGGWAGNCGDGGLGGSTWYLMCDRCREKYLREKRQALKEKTKKTKKKSTPVKQVVPVQILESHLVMKNNAMFLLDLASAAGLNLPHSQKQAPGPTGSVLPSVSEDSQVESQCPFPPAPCLYLSRQGAQGADSAFADDIIFSDREGVVLEHGDHRFTRSESAGDPARPHTASPQVRDGFFTGT